MQRINEAAQKFAEAVQESYQTMGQSTVEAQQRSTELAQSFFESAIRELNKQAESDRQAAQDVMEQSRKQQQAFQQLSQESAQLYMDFLNSVLSYYRGGSGRGSQSG